MRSRFCAFAIGDEDYLARTWHPSTRPHSIELNWFRLDIISVQGGPFDDDGFVEFIAYYLSPEGPGQLHERSRFHVSDRRWFYLHGLHLE